MKLGALIASRRPAILGRWRDEIASTYHPDAARFLSREKDRFANPVGWAIEHCTEAVLDQVAGAMDPDAVKEALDPIIRIRAVQDMSPSMAVAFVFGLKTAARDELGPQAGPD